MSLPQYTTIRKQGRKNVSIIVRPDSSVRIIVPHTMEDEAVRHIARTRESWINKKLDEFRNSDFQHTEHHYQEGEQFLFMGRQLTLVISFGRGNIDFGQNTLKARVPPGLKGKDQSLYIRQKLHDHCKVQALNYLREKTCEMSGRHKLSPVYVSVKDYKSRWGSCFSDGRIYYNWKLILAPENIIEYVIAHELCHLKVPNHSKQFWHLVETIIPDWRLRRKWLRINGHALYI